MGTTNRPPQSATWPSCWTTSSLRFQGRISTRSGCVSRDPVGVVDRDVRARQEPPLLVAGCGRPCSRGDRADPAVVQQRVALAGRPVAGDRLPCPLGAAIRNSTSLHFVCLDPVRRMPRRSPGRAARCCLAWPQASHALASAGGSASVGVAGVDPKRAAMRREFFDVEDSADHAPRGSAPRREARSTRSARGRWCRTGCPRSVAAGAGTRASRARSARAGAQALHEVVEVGHLGQHVVPDDEVGRRPFGDQGPCRRRPEELDERGDAPVARRPRRRSPPAPRRAPGRPGATKYWRR